MEMGEGKGEGYTINIPLPGGQGDLEYANIFNSLVLPIGLQYKPELIVVSAGFDGYHGDKMSAMRLSHAGFGYMARSIVNLAGANLAGADLTNTNLSGANLTGCDFSNSDLSGANLIRATANGANFEGAELDGSHLESIQGLKY